MWMFQADPREILALVAAAMCWALAVALYTPFLAEALQTKLIRPFADKRMRLALAATSIALFFAVPFAPPPIGPLLLFLSLALLFGFALIASIHAGHVAKGVARTRAGVFALAFDFRDICWGAIYAAVVREILSGVLVLDTVLHQLHVYAMGTSFRFHSLPMASCERISSTSICVSAGPSNGRPLRQSS